MNSDKQARTISHSGIASIDQQLGVISDLAGSAGSERKLPNLCLKTASEAMQLCRTDADLVLAYLRLPGQKESESTALIRQALMVIVLGFAQHINEHTLQHLVAATILVLVCSEGQTPFSEHSLRRLRSLFRKRGLTIWRDVLALRKALAEQKALSLLRSPALRRYQRLVLIASILAQRLPQESLHSLLQQLAVIMPPLHHPELAALMRIPGTQGAGDRVLWKGAPAVLLTCRDHFGAVVKTSDKGPDDNEHQWVDVKLLKPGARKPMPFDTWLSYYEQCRPDQDADNNSGPFRREYPINRPPGRLLQIIDALQATDTDIEALCELIEKEPVFSDFLRQSASSDNRLQLPVHNLKQAVLTYGTERVGDMLTQQALQTRLNQYNYPLGTTLRHFSVLVSTLAAQLAVHSNTRFTSQSAALVATFLTAPLFMLTGFKTLGKLPVVPEHTHNIQKLMAVKGTENWQSLVSDLAQGWHQPATWRALLYHTGKIPSDVPRTLQKEYSLLCLAVFWGSSWLFEGSDESSPLPVTITQAIEILALPHHLATAIRDEMASLLYCPLDL